MIIITQWGHQPAVSRRWMEVRDWLKHETDNGKKPIKRIIFSGERFDVMSVRRWRERTLGS